MIFRVLPVVKIAWRYVGIGAIITALLFLLWKASAWPVLGAEQCHFCTRGSRLHGDRVVVGLFLRQILFFGAKYTQIYFNRYGSQLEPMPGAKAVTLKEVVSA